MKATGVIRGVDHLGRVVIPKELRRIFRLGEGSHVQFFVDSDCIILKKFNAVADMEQLLESFKSSIEISDTLVPPAQMRELLSKVQEMKQIITKGNPGGKA